MNKRMREPYYSLMYKASEGWNDHLWQVPPELLERFADFIVVECARLAKQTPCPYEDTAARETYGHTWNMASISAGSNILNHFAGKP
jgi:hypothetical protein